ncbi:GcrA family cell cycle regulator [Lichenibacterium minor]|nr:GcrA family cell cycle regulator [Lichenibacterium minor]
MVLSPPVLAGERGFAPAFPHFPPAAAAVASLAPHECRWPLGEPGDAGFVFCGGTRLPHGSYCAVHARTAGPATAGRGGRA